MSADTNTLSYWLNWRFFLCAIWVFSSVVAATMIIWKYETFSMSKTRRRRDGQETIGYLYRDEAWRTCSKAIHPGWLLAVRMIAFLVLFAMLSFNIFIDGGHIFYYYTLWTFALVTLYFGIGSSFSIYGCFYCFNEVENDRDDTAGLDVEHSTYMTPTYAENADLSNMAISLVSREEPSVRRSADIWGFVFQVIFQVCAGAVMLTDIIFWFVIYPFLTPKDYKLNFLKASMHSLNAAFLIADIMLNRLRFPFFRIAYFVQFTSIYVIFQWTIHACVSMKWPYQFLDLSSPYAPIWYLANGLVQLPGYGIIFLIVRTKHVCLSRFSYS
ncbi:UPF0641 membrane protein like [Heracleum sosnowskyi]|uniref:UPF0641 membrane protein like n=1 Tax=Heracleum sosnowskyi TaxID=360622 RepID=A0AAD8I288_9APIA|nr:UPF0641 membrane protein like [Heracleum sosnowskyi]